MKKIWIVISLIIVVALVIVLVVTQTKKEPGEIEIGIILPLTGPASNYGQWTKEGMDIAQDELKKDFPQLRMRLIYEDDGGKAEQATSAINKLIKIDRVPVITGAILSQVALSISPIAERNKVILLSTGASSDKMKTAGDYIFRIRESSKYHGKKAAELAISEAKEAAVIFLNAENGLSYAEEFKKYYESMGGVIKIWEGYNEGENDFRTYLTKTRDTNIRVVYIPGLVAEIAQILKQSKELGIKTLYISSVGAQNPKLIEIAQEAANGLIYTYPAFDPSFCQTNAQIKTFVDKYISRYGHEPEFLAANGYDAIKLLAQVIIGSGYSADKIKTGLYLVKEFNGVGGKISFDQYGEAIKEVIVKIVRNKKFELK